MIASRDADGAGRMHDSYGHSPAWSCHIRFSRQRHVVSEARVWRLHCNFVFHVADLRFSADRLSRRIRCSRCADRNLWTVESNPSSRQAGRVRKRWLVQNRVTGSRSVRRGRRSFRLGPGTGRCHIRRPGWRRRKHGCRPVRFPWRELCLPELRRKPGLRGKKYASCAGKWRRSS